ncbi:hypothetical protein [Streptomyces luteogriseus]|uniref:hypothetical protein n=1 Tax=Streptomyces luteogriseus TaxID=68233 RepID=UPI00383051E4
MRERSDGVEESSAYGTEGPKRIDLNVPQVAGGAVAAVLAAKLASYFGVYGTILGAGVVSVVATCGGSLFQHFFKRTGEQIRDATAVAARPSAGQAPPRPGEFTEGTVYRARTRSWKRPVLAAVAVFGVTMAGITTYELVSGHNLSGGRSTTVGDAFSRGGASSTDSGDSGGSGGSDSSTPDDPGTEDAPPTDPPGSGTSQGGNPSPSTSGSGRTTPGPAPTPSATGSEDAGSTTPGATPTPPEPSASSRSGTADQDRDDPAAP